MGDLIARTIGTLPLSVEAFETAAAEATGLSDFGDPYYREGLEILLDSLGREADLTMIGSLMLQRAAFLALQRRLQLAQARKRDPEIFAKALRPPLIVTGLPRTGTTFFHRLLAQDPAWHAPRLYELLQPLPLADAAGRRLNRLRLSIELAVFRRMTRGLDARHFTRADEPEECMFAICQSFRSLMFWSLAPVYAHVAWYLRQERRRKYAEYLGTLQALQAAHPDRRLLLKAPEHLGALDEILSSMPGAMVVVCRRDPAAAVASFASLLLSTHGATSHRADPRRLARVNLDLLAGEADRHARARAAHPGRCLDIDHEALLRAPAEAAAAVYRHFGLDLPEEVRLRFQAFAADNPPDKHGPHRYGHGRFAQRPEAITERFTAYEAARG